MDSEIRDCLLDLNPWQRDPSRFQQEVADRSPGIFVPRMIDQAGFEDTAQAKMIVGPRQAGKSTFVWSLIREREPRSVLFLNAEERLVRRWAGSPARMLRDLEQEFPSVRTLFFEEIQHIEDAGLMLKGLVDAGRDLDILVTGSSSFHLSDRTRESLAGRAERRLLMPFSISEIIAHEPSAVPAVQKERAVEVARRMMVRGSYPRVWFSEEPARELNRLVEAFVLRDASDRLRIRRPEAFRQLMQLSAGQIGQMANYSEWAGHLGLSASTVRQYLGLLEETWILRLLPAFAGGARREITSAARVHFYDMGLRNALLGAFGDDLRRRPDRGALMEGLAFGELVKTLPSSWSLHYWRAKGGAEVDFVLVRGDRRIAVEVKAGLRDRLSRSARSFIQAYSPESFLIVTGQATARPCQTLESTSIRRVNLAELSRTVKKVVTFEDSEDG